jgi:DNA-binding IclR family transcriptional regulator
MNPRPLANTDDDGNEATVKTIDRAARLLRVLSSYPEGTTLSAASREAALGKSTTHRLLGALIDAGLVFQEQESKHYRLGAGLALLGRAAHQQDLASLAKPFLLRLAEETEDTIYASVREGIAAVCVAREIGAFPIRTLSLDVGHRRPLGVGSGSLALIAFLPDHEVSELIERNANWLARYAGHSRKDMLSKVADTRQRGFSFVEGKIVPGMSAIGVPVFGPDRRPVAALSLAAIADRVSGSRISQLARLLSREAAVLGRTVGITAAPMPAPRSSSRKQA